jgi:hypothetical protein
METDLRESDNDCTHARGEEYGSRGETFHPIYAASPVSSSVEQPVCWSNWVVYKCEVDYWYVGWRHILHSSFLTVQLPTALNTYEY